MYLYILIIHVALMLDNTGHQEREGIGKGRRTIYILSLHYNKIEQKTLYISLYLPTRIKKALTQTLTKLISRYINKKASKATISTNMASTTSTSTLYFDPDLHPDDTLRAFDEFIQSFELCYDAQYPDPGKVEALKHITPPRSKEELISFLCMMQSNGEFISNFAQHAAKLRELTKKNSRFTWTREHHTAYEAVIKRFTSNTPLEFFDMSKQTFIFTDAHITGLDAMLAQGDTPKSARPIAIASRATSKAEQRYPQIDLEALGIDFALRRFRNYILGSPTEIQVIIDHKLLCSIFNVNCKGSIRTERIKLRHQDIRFTVNYQCGKVNQSDYLSRHAKPIEKLPREEQTEANDLNNLLYLLHTTPAIDCMDIGAIAQATSEDQTLQKIATLIKNGQTWIPKTEVQHFRPILPQLTLTGNGIILKDERIILRTKFQERAIQIAHKGAHPGQGGLKRRLRYHFLFHSMDKKVEEFVKSCSDCNVFVDKKTKEPIKPHRVPERCWETVAVDLFGPMPSSKHVVVVQDLASRYPAAKLVTSALTEIYETYGNPDVQISNNGPPFNSIQMHNFAKTKDIKLQTTPPLQPTSNPVETFMRPLGKAMKTGRHNGMPENESPKNVLRSYRQTPHTATGLPPATMIFCHGQRLDFPRRHATDKEVAKARVKQTRRRKWKTKIK